MGSETGVGVLNDAFNPITEKARKKQMSLLKHGSGAFRYRG
jgi:hypothetical protein